MYAKRYMDENIHRLTIVSTTDLLALGMRANLYFLAASLRAYLEVIIWVREKSDWPMMSCENFLEEENDKSYNMSR
jgi:hypothetical protein